MKDSEKKEKREGEWVITYTPPGGGIGHSRALSHFAPKIFDDHENIEGAKKEAKKVIASQLNNPKHPQYIHRDKRWEEFGLAWMEEYSLERKQSDHKPLRKGSQL